jgi:PRC-barrel domain
MFHMLSKLKGFHIVATDGPIGHVDEFLLDEKWTVRHLVVDTSNWVGGTAVLIPATAVQAIDAPRKHIHVGLSRDEIAKSPGLDSVAIEPIEKLPPAIM